MYAGGGGRQIDFYVIKKGGAGGRSKRRNTRQCLPRSLQYKHLPLFLRSPMTDLLHTIPDFPTKTYTHLFPSLEKHCVTTADLLTLDAVEIARRAQLPVLDIRRLANQVIEILGGQLGLAPAAGGGRDDGVVLNPSSAGGEGGGSRKSGNEVVLDQKWSVISTLDDSIDAALGGGIPTGYITEFTGERYDVFLIRDIL